jgi:hypothetical protein
MNNSRHVSVHKVLVRKRESKIPLRRSRCRCKEVKPGLKETERGGPPVKYVELFSLAEQLLGIK